MDGERAFRGGTQGGLDDQTGAPGSTVQTRCPTAPATIEKLDLGALDQSQYPREVVSLSGVERNPEAARKRQSGVGRTDQHTRDQGCSAR